MEYQTFLTVLAFLASNKVASSVETSCPSTCQSCDNERVMCRSAQLTSLPSPISEETLVVDLTQNDINSIDGVPSLPAVQSMRLSQNQISVITGGAFEAVPSLMSLDLSMNKITKVYAKGFMGLDQLLSLSLTGNKLSSIGAMFEQCKSVTSVKLGNNEINSIEEEDFQHNKELKMLDLSFNKIKSIHPNAFKNLNMLRILILSNNPLIMVQDLTFSSNMLSLVDFTSCMLTSVPKTMPPSLHDFRLGNNKITKILQDDFQNITNLRILFLNDNEITDVEHRSFSGLDNLKELWLSRNQLVYIPRGLPMNLEKLLMDSNHVVELEPMLFKNGSKLMKLSLESNNVRKVHQDSLNDMYDLDELNLQGNEISLIDVGTFTTVPNLKVLKLSYNPVKVFENGAFADLDSLSELYMSNMEHTVTGRDRLLDENFISEMPNLTKVDLTSSVLLTKKLFELFEENPTSSETVKTIILQYNDLGTVPEVLKTIFPNVENLVLDGNPFVCNKKLIWLNQWMSESSVNFHKNEDLMCNEPTSLKGRLVSELQADEFVEVVNETPEQPQPQTPAEATEPPSGNQQESQSRGPSSAETQPSQEEQTGAKEAQQNNGDSPSQPNPPSQPKSSSNQPSTSQSKPYGVRVVIKPPSGGSGKPSPKPKKQKMSKAERAARKAARKAERERKRRQREARKKGRKRHVKGDSTRKKRRIRKKDSKRCTVDEKGEMQCERRKKCKVDDDGNVVCKKRKERKNKKNKATQN